MKEKFYLTISKDIEYEIPKIKKSRFITYCFGVDSEYNFKSKLAEIKKTHYSARHRCRAYKIRKDENNLTGYSDDGEPNGSAGKPIFMNLDGSGLVNLGVVVVRYFGGIKLGVGGLVQAYGNAVKSAINQIEQKKVDILSEFELYHNYDQTSLVHKMIDTYSGKIISIDYGDQVNTKFLLNDGYFDKFRLEIFDKSSGKIIINSDK